MNGTLIQGFDNISRRCMEETSHSLGQLMEGGITYEVLSVDRHPLEDILNEMVDPRNHFGIFMGIEGEFENNILIMIPDETAISIVSSVMGKKIDPSTLFDEITMSCLLEVGNIMTSAYCGAMVEQFDTDLIPTPPDISYDDPRTLLGYGVVQFGGDTDDTIFTKSRLHVEKNEMDMMIFMIPPENTLKILEERL